MSSIENLKNVFEWAKDNTEGYDNKNILVDSTEKLTDYIYQNSLTKRTYTSGYWTSPNGTDRDIQVKICGGSYNYEATPEQLEIANDILGWTGYSNISAPFTAYRGYKNGYFTSELSRTTNNLNWYTSYPENCYWHELYYGDPFRLSLGGLDSSISNLNYKFGALSGELKIGYYLVATWTSHGRNCCGWHIMTIDLVHNIKEFLGLQNNGFEYKTNDPIYGSGGVAQGLQGIVDTLSDDINIPLKSNKGVTSTGFINLYEITNNALVNFGKDMFSDIDINFNGMSSDEWLAIMNDSNTKLSQIPEADRPEASEWLANTFNASYGISDLFKLGKQVAKNFFNSMLIKYVLSVHIIPVEPTTSANSERINVGFKQFNQTAKRITSDYIDYDYGTLTIPSKYKNFLDFTNTHCKIFIPFTGFVDIDPKYVYDQTIGLKVRFNVIDGTCVTFLTTTGLTGSTSVIGTYNGSCCVHLPFTGENYSNMISGVISGVGGVVSGVATANPMLAIGGGINGMSSVANGLGGSLLGSPQTSASASFMGMRTPYIVIERPIPQLPPRYFKDHGAVANIVEKPINCSGFTKCTDVQINATVKSDIATKLKEIMESGFIV